MKSQTLPGNRISLRPLVSEDARILVPWLNDPEVTRTLAIGRRAMDLHAEEAFLEKTNTSPHDVIFGITLRASNKLIGSAGLDHVSFCHRRANFGIMIGEKGKWGQGYGTEATTLVVEYAFKELDLNRVQLHAYEFNPAGIRAYEKVGFMHEGMLRQEHFYNGRYWGTVVMAIVREDWEKMQAQR